MSGITIPRAGIEAGRAPRAQSVEAPALGRAAAAFGETMRGVGETLERDRQERELTAFRTNIAGRLGETRLKYQRATNPDEIAQGWEPEISALRQEALSGVSGAVRDEATATFDQLVVPHKLAIGEREIGLRRDARLFGAGRQAEETVAQSALAGDEETESALFSSLAATYATLVAAGDMSEGDAAAALQKAQADARRATALRLLTDDPARLLAEIDGPRFDGIDPAIRASLRDRADGAVNVEAARAEAEAARAANEAAAAADARLTEIATIAEGGRTSADEAFLFDPEAKERPGYQRAADAVALRQIFPGLATATPAQLDAAIAEERARPLAERHEARVLDALERTRDAAVKAWKDDPVAHAQEVGMRQLAPLPDPSAFGDEAIVTALRERSYFGQSLVKAGYTESESYFTKQERAQLAAQTGPERPAAERARLAGLIASAFGAERAPRALAEIGGDALFGHAGGLVASGGDPATAERILRGQAELAAGNVTLPKGLDVQTVVGEMLGEAFDQSALPPAQLGVIREAALAIYAAGRFAVTDPEDFEEPFGRALNEALGGVYSGGRLVSGGLYDRGTIYSDPLLLPPGVTPDAFEAGFERIAAATGGAANPWPALSRSGGAPVFAGGPLTRETLEEARIVAFGNDRYGLQVERGGQLFDVMDSESGAVFAFSLRAMADPAR